METLLLIERKLPQLESFVRSELQNSTAVKPLGNVSLHRWMTTHGIELERSEYSLTLAALTARDSVVWNTLRPTPRHAANELFIRLRAITYGRGRGPLLYTQENLVPGMFDLGVTGFKFRPGTKLMVA